MSYTHIYVCVCVNFYVKLAFSCRFTVWVSGSVYLTLSHALSTYHAALVIRWFVYNINATVLNFLHNVIHLISCQVFFLYIHINSAHVFFRYEIVQQQSWHVLLFCNIVCFFPVCSNVFFFFFHVYYLISLSLIFLCLCSIILLAP